MEREEQGQPVDLGAPDRQPEKAGGLPFRGRRALRVKRDERHRQRGKRGTDHEADPPVDILVVEQAADQKGTGNAELDRRPEDPDQLDPALVTAQTTRPSWSGRSPARQDPAQGDAREIGE